MATTTAGPVLVDRNAEEAAALTPADWHPLYERVQTAQYVLLAYSRRDDLDSGGGTKVIRSLAEQIKAGQRHNRQRYNDEFPPRPGHHRIMPLEPCCDHVARAEAEAADLRRQLADLHAALTVADAALEQYRR